MIVLLALLVLLAPLASAHTAAPPRSDYTRLLHDCSDDYFGGDGFGNGADGYDLHSVDLREAWSSTLSHHVIFRTILNGEGPSTLTLTFKADGASKSYTWQGEGSSWTGSFDDVTYFDDLDDGPRFALEGAIKRSTLGLSVGDKITDVRLVGSHNGDTHDSVPGDDTGALQSCTDQYNPGTGYTLKGPVQYVSAAFQQTDVEVENGQETFVTLDLSNLLRDAAQSATVRLSSDGEGVRLHDPRTGEYVTTGTFDLNKRGSAGSSSFIHVAVGGATGSGTATVTVTTDLGGRVTQQLDYEILPPGETATTTSTTAQQEDGEDAPAAPIALLLVGLVLLARRR